MPQQPRSQASASFEKLRGALARDPGSEVFQAMQTLLNEHLAAAALRLEVVDAADRDVTAGRVIAYQKLISMMSNAKKIAETPESLKERNYGKPNLGKSQ